MPLIHVKSLKEGYSYETEIFRFIDLYPEKDQLLTADLPETSKKPKLDTHEPALVEILSEDEIIVKTEVIEYIE